MDMYLKIRKVDMNNTTSTFCERLEAHLRKGVPISSFGDVTEKQFLDCFPKAERAKNEGNDIIDNLIITYSLVLLIASVVGTLGNLAVINFYSRRFRSLSPWKFLVFHLACCDFLFALMQIVQAVPSFTGNIGSKRWPLGLTMCKITRASLVLGGLIAVQNILLIALERYKGIIYPLRQLVNTRKRIHVCVGVIWALSLISVLPLIHVSNVDENKSCELSWKSHGNKEKVYSIYLLLVFGLFPLLAIMYLSGQVVKKLGKPKDSDGIFMNLSAEVAQKRRKSELRIIKMLSVVVAAFFFCVIPLRIVDVIVSFVDESSLSVENFFILVYSGYLPYPLHVAVNPFIYTWGDHEFRNEIGTMCKPGTVKQFFTSKGTYANNSNGEEKMLNCKAKQEDDVDPV